MNSAATHAFDGSRRLTGANRYFATPAVVLEPLGPAALDGAAQGRWIVHVLQMAAALQWPALSLSPRVHAHAGGVVLAFAAPADTLFTATEVNEWAWERAAAEHPAHALVGFALAQPAYAFPLAHFQARARAERSAPLQRLTAAAATHGVPLLVDDDSVSIGEGRFCSTHPRAALPLPMDLPWPQLRAVPKVLITGSNGKTTTTRLLGAMARAAGLVPGLSSTEGVWVDGRCLATGDQAGPAGARLVLRHCEVTVALLETARGGILRRGLAVAQADVAIVTNVQADHLGEDGIDSLADLAQTKLAVAHALTHAMTHAQAHAQAPAGAKAGTLVLNGADDSLLRAAVHLPHATAAPWALFAREHAHPLLQALRSRGAATCGVHDGQLLLHMGGPC